MSVAVSICLLSWNHERYVEQAIESIRKQTYLDFEILYLDNASNDKTYEKALACLADIPVHKVTIKNEVPKRTAENMNMLYTFVRGKYIAHMSCDDWWHPHNLKVKVSYYEQHPHIGMLYGSGWTYYDDTAKMEEVDTTTFKRGNVFNDLILGNFIFSIGFMTKPEVMRKVGSWNKDTHVEDWDMWLRLAQHYSIDFITVPTVYYRRHSSNSSALLNGNYFDEKLKVLDQYNRHANYKQARSAMIKGWVHDNVSLSSAKLASKVLLTHFRPTPFYCKQVLRLIFLNFKNFFSSNKLGVLQP